MAKVRPILITESDEDKEFSKAYRERLRLATQEKKRLAEREKAFPVASGVMNTAEELKTGAIDTLNATGQRGLELIGAVPEGSRSADSMNRANDARLKSLTEKRHETTKPLAEAIPGFEPVTDAAMGVAQQLPQMVGGNKIAGFKGIVALFAAGEGNQAYTSAKDAGLDDVAARDHALTAMAIEAGVTSAFQAVGLGGAEKAVQNIGKQIPKDAVKRSLMKKMTEFGVKELSPELVEELITEAGHSFNRAETGVDPNATSKEALWDTAVSTTLQTMLTMGALKTMQSMGDVERPSMTPALPETVTTPPVEAEQPQQPVKPTLIPDERGVQDEFTPEQQAEPEQPPTPVQPEPLPEPVQPEPIQEAPVDEPATIEPESSSVPPTQPEPVVETPAPSMRDWDGDTNYGDMVSTFREGDVPTNNAGRKATKPYPRVDVSTSRKAKNTIKRVDQWLQDEAIAEARERNDYDNLRAFQGIDHRNITPADRDGFEAYLFDPEGNQPTVTPIPFDRWKNLQDAKAHDDAKKEVEKANEEDSFPMDERGNVDTTGKTDDEIRAEIERLKAGKAAGKEGRTIGPNEQKALDEAKKAEDRMKQPNHESRQRGEKPEAYQRRLVDNGWIPFSSDVSSYTSPDLQNAQDIQAMKAHRDAGLKVGERVTVAEESHAIGGIVQTEGGLNHADILLDNGQRIFAGGESIHFPENTSLTTPKKTIGQSKPEPKAKPTLEEMEKAIMDKLLGGADEVEERAAEEKTSKKLGSKAKEAKDKANDLWADIKSDLEGYAGSGLNPAIAQKIAKATALEVQAGTLNFASFIANIKEQIGDELVAKFHDEFRESWDTIRDAFKDHYELDESSPPAKPEPKKSIAASKIKLNDKETVQESIADFLYEGGRVSNITQLRNAIANKTGNEVKPGTIEAKEADEVAELGVVMAAKRIVLDGKRDDLSPKQIYDNLVDLYDRQPNLGVRDSESMRMQAYSTPVPLAYLAAIEAGVTNADVVYDPTAGNGALLIGAQKRVANELGDKRAEQLKFQGIETTQKDATEYVPERDIDVVISNPPFGKDPDNKNRKWTIDGDTFTELDHVIALKALDKLPDDGRAVLIVGSKGFEQSKPKEDVKRANAYSNKNQKGFWDQLYDKYNVTDHYTVDGSLYSKQGAKFPVDVIVIDGKGKSGRAKPYNFVAGGIPKVHHSWKELSDEKIERLGVRGETPSGDNREGDSDSAETERDRTDLGTSSEPDVPSSSVGESTEPASDATVRTGMGSEDGRVTDDRREPSGPRTDGSVSGDVDASGTESSVVPDQSETERVSSGTDRAKSGSDATAERNDKLDASEHQASYTPSSKLENVDTLVPVNHQAAVARKLEELADTYGDLDQFVASELGYDPNELGRFFSAEQVDALAMAMASHKEGKGFVNGDMTGVGKGRFVAGMIEYAKRNNMVPVFLTEKPSLYADMMRDLTDIDRNSEETPFNPLITNDLTGDNKIDLHAQTRFGERVASQGGAIAKRRAMEAVDNFNKNGKLAANYSKKNAKNPNVVEHDAIFTSYSQMQTTKGGKETWRHDFFRSVAPNAFFILDESHNAGGGQKPLNMQGEEVEQDGLPMSEFVREVINQSPGTVFASATFAKRPEVMSLYANTGIADAMNDVGALEEIIVKGGVPMQQVLSEMMVENGRYLRREKSYKGVTMNPKVVETDGDMLDEVSGIFRGIQHFDVIKNSAINKKDSNGHSMVDHIVSGGGKLGDDNAIGKKGIDSTTFSSKLWNLVDQMLLAAKAEAVAAEAIETIKRGESPIIAVDKTMEASLRQFLEDNPALDGEPIDYNMKTLYRNYLERTRELLIKHDKKDPDSWERIYLTDEQIGPAGVEAYKAALKQINDMEADLPASPIDMIRHKIEEAGYTVAEITGRKYAVDYSEGTPRMGFRPESETGNEGKLATVNAFNSNNLDVVILNRSGSTGLSLHASEKFENKNRRHMIIAEASKNIDTFMQTLGRSHRTGQVTEHEGQEPGSNLPYYSLLMTDAPAEIRVASVLAKKLSSLNANVTASAKGDVQFDVPDVINEVGDAVVLEHLVSESMNENDLFMKLDVGEPEGESVPPGFAKKVTGRVALLPLEEQHQFWDDVTRKYDEKIDQLDRMNANPLSAATLDLDAVIEESTKIFDGEDSNNAFAQPAYLETADVRKKIDLMQPEDIDKEINESLDGQEARHWAEKNMKAADDSRKEYVESKRGKLKDTTFARMVEGTSDRNRTIMSAFRRFQPGTTVVVNDNGRDAAIARSLGIVLNVRRSGRSKDPTALGAWEVIVATKDSRKKIRIPLTKIGGKSGYELWPSTGVSLEQAKDKFAEESVEGREKRFIGTGNILAAFEELKDGNIVFFTDRKGEKRRGVLMPRSFNAERWAKNRPVVLNTVAQANEFMERGGMLTSPDKAVQVGIFGNQLVFRSPKSRSRSGQFTTNKSLTNAAKSTFVTKGQLAEMVVLEKNANAALEVLLDLTPMQTAMEKDKAMAREIKGEDAALRMGRDRSTNRSKALGALQSGAPNRPTPSGVNLRDGKGDGQKGGRSPREIVDAIRKKFGVEIRRGNFGQRSAGIWKSPIEVSPDIIRMALDGPNDIAVATHEVAHHLDRKLNLTSYVNKRKDAGERNYPSHGPAVIPSDVANAMEGLDYDEKANRDFEGWAEFVRLYITQPAYLQESADARRVLKWFEGEFKSKFPTQYKQITETRDMVQGYSDMSALARGHNAISKRDPKRNQLLESIFGNDKHMLLSKKVDKFHGLKMLEEAGVLSGFDYDEAVSAHEFASATNRSSLSHAERATKDGVHRITDAGEGGSKYVNDNPVGIHSIIKGFTEHEFNSLGAYLHARITLFDPSHKTGLDPQDARRIVDQIEGDPKTKQRFQEAEEHLAQFNNDLIRMAQDAGLFTPEEMQRMFVAYEGTDGENRYVPLLRVRKGRGGAGSKGSRLSVPRAVYGKTRRGSDDPIVHPFHATLERAVKLYDAANRQQLLSKVVEEASEIEGAGFLVERLPQGKKAFKLRASEILGNMVNDGFIPRDRARAIGIAEEIRDGSVVDDDQTDFLIRHFDADSLDHALQLAPDIDTIYTLWRPDWPLSHTGENIMRLVQNGKPAYYQVHPLIAAAINEMSPMQRGVVLRTFTTFTRSFKAGTTALSTGFGARQITMDWESALIQSREMDVSTVRKTLKAMSAPPAYVLRAFGAALSRSALGKKLNQYGDTSSPHFALRAMGAVLNAAAETEVQRLYEEYGGTLTHGLKADEVSMRKFVEQPVKKGLAKRAVNTVRHPVQTVENVTDWIAQYVATGDLGPRLAEFEATLNNHGYIQVRHPSGDSYIAKEGDPKTPVMPPQRVLIRAVNAAQDITYNYRRMGSDLQFIEPIFPFTNAAIQSTDKQFRTMRGLLGGKDTSIGPTRDNYSRKNHWKRIGMVASLKMSALTLIALAEAGDDDDEKEKSFGKRRSLEYGSEGKTKWALPHSREYAAMYAAAEIAGEEMAAQFKGEEGEDAMKELSDAMWEDAKMRLPSYASGLLGAGWGIATNTDPFFGNEIEPTWMDQAGIADVDKTDEKVNAAAEWAAKLDQSVSDQVSQLVHGTRSDGVGSPKQYDYIFNQITGGAYRRAGKTLGKITNGEFDQLNWEDVPFAKGIVLNRHQKKSIGDFYTRLRGLETVKSLDKDDMSSSEKQELVRMTDYKDLMSDFHKAQRPMTNKDHIDEGNRLIVGLAREALGIEPLKSNPSPLMVPKSEWPKHMSGAYESTVDFVQDKVDLTRDVRAPKTGGNLESRKASYAARKAEATEWLSTHSHMPFVSEVIANTPAKKPSKSTTKKGFSKYSR